MNSAAALRARDDRPMEITRHLSELRRVLIIAGAAWLVCTTIAMVFNSTLLYWLLAPLRHTLSTSHSIVDSAIITSPTEGLTVPLKVAAVAGIVLALPVILWQVWGFVKPALNRSERRVAGPILASALVLFTIGAGFAYVVMPLGLSFLATFLGGNATYLPDINAYLSFMVLLILAFGITFELPVVVLLLGIVGITSSAGLRRRRGTIWIGIVTTALMVTPGADPFTPLALLIPLLALFEGSVLVLDKALHK